MPNPQDLPTPNAAPSAGMMPADPAKTPAALAPDSASLPLVDEPDFVSDRPSRWRTFRHSVSGMVGLILVLILGIGTLLVLVGVLGSDPLAQAPAVSLKAPSAAHWFGTDQFGRDIFSRVAHGLANSLLIAVVAVGFATCVGTLLGVIAGYMRGPADLVISGITNVLFAFPPLLLALALVSVLERTWFTIAVAIAIVYVPIFIRITRGPVLSLREIAYVRAAISTGQSRWAIMFNHVLPNISSIIIVQVTLSLSWAVLTEASLSFLGLGTPPPAPSLGSMMYEARSLASIAPWTLYAPGIIVVALVVGLNLLGDGLRDTLDPTYRGAS